MSIQVLYTNIYADGHKKRYDILALLLCYTFEQILLFNYINDFLVIAVFYGLLILQNESENHYVVLLPDRAGTCHRVVLLS
jgi:hypothetical protein